MAETWKARAERLFLKNYPPPSLLIVRGEGAFLYDGEGKAYLDLLGGIAVNSLGHCHPAVTKAVREQCGRLMHISNLYQHPVQIELAERLTGRFPGGKVFFCNSGAEANEAAIKLVRKWSHGRHGPGRSTIISALQSFHGRTVAALTATGQAHYQEGFGPLLPGIRHVPFDDISALEEAAGDDVCAVLLEPIQGEGGVVLPSPGYLAAVGELCRRRGMLLVLDEVQTGVGRTGSFFAFETEGVEPDVVTLSKALGGGLPLGAMLARGEAAEAFQPGGHASTFGGNPVACAAALAVLDCLDGGLLERVNLLGTHFRAGLESLAARLPRLLAVRGRGLLLAAELDCEAKPIVAEAQERGYLINAVQPKVLRFAPPFVIEKEEIDRFLELLEEILKARA